MRGFTGLVADNIMLPIEVDSQPDVA